MENARHIIWSNDAVAEYNWLEQNPAKVREMLGYEENEPFTEENLWGLAYEQVDANFDAECANLQNCKTDGIILALGKVERWNGTRSAFAELTGNSVADILRFVADKAAGNTATLFVQDGDIILEMYGHDNPTSPTRMTFRALRRNVSEAGKQKLLDAFYYGEGNRWTLAQTRTKRLGYLPAAVYGWKDNLRKAA